MKGASRRFLITAVLLGATAGGLKFWGEPGSEKLIRPLDAIATQMCGWTMTGSYQLSNSVAGVLDASAYVSRQYRKDGQPLMLFVAYYSQQRTGETMHSPRHCLPGAGWEIWRQDSARIGFRGKPVTINKFSIQNGDQHMLVYYWYQSKKQIVASEYLGKLLLVRDAIIDRNTAGTIVRVMVPDTPQMAKDGLLFAAAVEREIESCLGP